MIKTCSERFKNNLTNSKQGFKNKMGWDKREQAANDSIVDDLFVVADEDHAHNLTVRMEEFFGFNLQTCLAR